MRYLGSKQQFLRYDQALQAGWPIATAIIEGACRYLIADRLDIGGARWGLDGAEAVLTLRAVISNGDFEEYWRFHLACEHQRLYPGTVQGQHTLGALPASSLQTSCTQTVSEVQAPRHDTAGPGPGKPPENPAISRWAPPSG